MALALSLGVVGCGSHANSVVQTGSALDVAPSLQMYPSGGGGTFEIFPLEKSNAPFGLAADPLGDMWFTLDDPARIGRISALHVVTTFNVPTRFSQPDDIVAGPDGNMWFTEFLGGRLGRVAMDGSITEVHARNMNHLYHICVGPDGALWFTGQSDSLGGQLVGRMTLTGQQSDFPIPAAFGITSGPDGNLWITGADTVYKMTVAGAVTTFKTIPNTGIGNPVFGADGNLWFWFYDSKARDYGFGKLTTHGALTEYPLGTNHVVGPGKLASAYHKIWAPYDHGTGDGLAEIDERGHIIEHFPSQCGSALSVALGADGHIWFSCVYDIDAYVTVTEAR